MSILNDLIGRMRARLGSMAHELVRVLTTASIPEAEIARSRLQDEGIPVMASGLDSPYRMGPIHLLVPIVFEVQARLILEATTPGPVDAPDAEGPGERAPLDPGESGRSGS